jgi:Domain of unknown function (DUF4440)
MKTAGFWLIVACALSLPVPAQKGGEGGAAETIRALERQWVVAQSHNDNHALDLIFDNDLVYVEYGSLVSKSDYLARVKHAPANLDQIVMESITVRTFDTTAIVVGSFRETQIRDGRTLVKRWRFLDTWVYEKSGWILVAAASAPMTE